MAHPSELRAAFEQKGGIALDRAIMDAWRPSLPESLSDEFSKLGNLVEACMGGDPSVRPSAADVLRKLPAAVGMEDNDGGGGAGGGAKLRYYATAPAETTAATDNPSTTTQDYSLPLRQIVDQMREELGRRNNELLQAVTEREAAAAAAAKFQKRLAEKEAVIEGLRKRVVQT